MLLRLKNGTGMGPIAGAELHPERAARPESHPHGDRGDVGRRERPLGGGGLVEHARHVLDRHVALHHPGRRMGAAGKRGQREERARTNAHRSDHGHRTHYRIATRDFQRNVRPPAPTWPRGELVSSIAETRRSSTFRRSGPFGP